MANTFIMNKTIYTSKEKGVRWTISVIKTYNTDTLGWFNFYLLPNLEYHRNKMFEFDGEDCCFTIDFHWLFWGVSVERCWGTEWEKLLEENAH